MINTFNRRQFLKTMATGAALTALKPWHIFAETTRQKINAQRNWPAFLRDVHQWHCAHFFDFDKHLSQSEQNYLQTCFGLTTQYHHQLTSGIQYSLFSYSHRVKGQKVNSTRFYYGSFTQRERLQPFIKEIYQHRGIQVTVGPYLTEGCGLGWDFEKEHFKVYWPIDDFSQLKDPDLIPLYKKVNFPIHQQGLASYTFRGRKIIEKKIYVACKERVPTLVAKSPFHQNIVHTNVMVTTERGMVPQVDLNEEVKLDWFNQKGKDIVTRYKEELDEPLDTLAYLDKERYALYFP